MLLQRVYRFTLVFGLICCVPSCGGAKPPVKQVVKVAVTAVEGNVTVDGKPEAGVIAVAAPLGEIEGKDAINPRAKTDEDGHYVFGTYTANDGLPPGEYAITFVWPPTAMRRGSRMDDVKFDQLNGKYASVEQSPLKFKLEPDTPLELKTIDLKTK
jgi:hypothetical protein